MLPENYARPCSTKQKVNIIILNAFDIVYKKTTRLHHCQSLRFLSKNELVASFSSICAVLIICEEHFIINLILFF